MFDLFIGEVFCLMFVIVGALALDDIPRASFKLMNLGESA